MRIAFNASILRTPRTGIGQYLCELINALQAEPDISTTLFDGRRWRTDLPPPRHPAQVARISGLKRWVPFAYPLRRMVEQYHFNRGLKAHTPDLYHDPSLWPLEFKGPTVMTVHDLTHLEHPETQPPDRLREIHRLLPGCLERAAHIMVDSQFIGGQLQHHYGITPHRITVAPLGYASRFHPRDAESLQSELSPLHLQPEGYLLCVGTLEPRKNLGLALRAHHLLPAPLRERFPLLIAGMAGWNLDQFGSELNQAVQRGHIRLLGYQSDEQLAALTAGARLLLFPSHYEGFGLPVLEAMASGTPVMLTRQSAMPEVAGDAGIYLPPDDPRAWADTLQQLLEDDNLRSDFQARGLARAQTFSWQRCAAITANVYRQVLNR